MRRLLPIISIYLVGKRTVEEVEHLSHHLFFHKPKVFNSNLSGCTYAQFQTTRFYFHGNPVFQTTQTVKAIQSHP